VVIGGAATLHLALLLVVAVTVGAIDELAQHAGVDPPVALGLGQEPGLHLIDYPACFIYGKRPQRFSWHVAPPAAGAKSRLLAHRRPPPASACRPRQWRSEL